MPVCPKCGSELESFKRKFVCSHEECDFSISQAKFPGLLETSEPPASIPWCRCLCQDERLWQKEAFEAYPSVIAHEYWRLYDLLRQGQPYGAFLQVKDVFEVLIKFPVLILVSGIYHHLQRSDSENAILIALLEKWLTLGTWEEIAKTLCKKSPKIAPVVALLQDIVILFHEHDIREWRNKTIGHGALAFEADEGFQHDIESKLRLLKRHFSRFSDVYANCLLYLTHHDQQIVLQGKRQASQLMYSNAELWFRIEEVCDVPLSPYVVLKDRGIYFFDSYIPREEKAVLLSYPDGDKQLVHNALLTNLYATLSKDSTLKQLSGSLTDDTYSAFQAETLDRIAVIDDFQQPVYLKRWLQELTETRAQGVFLLQMERGMGKTTFARALDHQSMNRMHLTEPDEFSVRSYYVNGAYRYKIEHFISRFNILLLTDSSGRVAIQGNLPVLSVLSPKKRHDFAELLNFYHREHQKHFQKERLLVILDGVDEIPASQDTSIFDFIPSPDALEHGVYLLLTCRTNAELSHFSRTQLETISPTAQLSVERRDIRHIDVLRAYITNHVPYRETLQTGLLLQQVDHRFLYLKALKELLKTSRNSERHTLSNGNALFTDFLAALEQMYGEKFFACIVRLLLILSLAVEPMTFKELSAVFGEPQPSFKLLAHLLDLRGFLKIEQSYRGNLFSLAHEELRDVMLANYHAILRELIQRWVQEYTAIQADHLSMEDEGSMYLLAHLPEYVSAYFPEAAHSVLTQEFAELLSAVAMKLQQGSLAEHHRERTIELYTHVMAIQRSLLATGLLQDERVLLKTVLNRGRAYSNMRRIHEAITDYDAVIDRQSELHHQQKSGDEEMLAAALVNRGNSYILLQEMKRGIADYARAIEIRQRLRALGTVPDECRLARVLVNRGTAYRRIHQLQKALADFDLAIDIQQRCFEDGTLPNEHELAAALMNRGIMFMQTHQSRKALADYNRAIALQRQLLRSGKLPDENYLARALINRAIVYEHQYQPHNAIPDFMQAIAIQEHLLNQGKLLDEHELARSFVNRGIAYKNCHQWQYAIDDYNRAVDILTDLLQRGILLDEYELAWTLMNRGETYSRIRQFAPALTDLNRAIAIQETLLKANIMADERELALTLINRGIVNTAQQQCSRALCDFDRALSIQNMLLRDGKLSDEDELAWGLLHRGIAYREDRRIDEAIADLNRAITLLERLHDTKSACDAHDLALAFLHRGMTFTILHDTDNALHDLQQASHITKALLPERPFLLETYAQSVVCRCSLLKQIERLPDVRILSEEFQHILARYAATDEAQYWQTRLLREG